MARFKKFNKFNGKKEKRDDQIYGGTRDKAANSGQEAPQDIAEGISYISGKDLPKSTYSIQTSPYDELNQASEPYNYVAKYNRKMEPKYKGEKNLDSGYVSQYLTAVTSRIYKNFDSAALYCKVHYRYLNLGYTKMADGSIVSDEPAVLNQASGAETIRGQGIIDRMYDAVNEAYSQLDATTFKTLDLVSNYSVVSNVYLTNPKKVEMNWDGVRVYVYTDPAAVFLLSALHYQCLLQTGISFIKASNKLKNYQRLELKMQYEREIAGLNEFFGQVNKQAFKNILNTAVLSIQGEFVDLEWSKQNNIFGQIPSRRSDSMVDPILEILPEYSMQTRFAMVYGSTGKYSGTAPSGEPLVYSEFDGGEIKNYTIIWCNHDIAADGADAGKSSFETVMYIERVWDSVNQQFIDNPHYIPYTQCIHNMTALCSINDTLLWARLMPNDGTIIRPIDRYNNIISLVRGNNSLLSKVKTYFGDLRTIFDKLTPVGFVNYKKGVTVDLTDKYDYKVEHFVMVDDIYRTYLSGPAQIEFDATTGRWMSYALWDKHYGIPLYDSINGGSFISLCTKDFDCSSSPNAEVDYLPIMFSVTSGDECRFINREGNFSNVKPLIYGHFYEDDFDRLAMLPVFDNYDIKVPVITENIGGYIPDYLTFNYLKMAVMNLVGIVNRVPASTGSGSHEIEIAPTTLTIYPYQIVSTTKAMISYGKAYGPIKGALTDVASVGFADIAGSPTTK